MPKKITQNGVEARRIATIQAASTVFLRYGYARTTMAELAAAAELSRPTLYELFPGKEDLFAAVIDRLSRQTIRHAAQARDAADEATVFLREMGNTRAESHRASPARERPLRPQVSGRSADVRRLHPLSH